MSHFPDALELCYILVWGNPVVLATTRSNETRLPPLLPSTTARFRAGGTQNQKYESRVTSFSPPHWLISLKGDGQWGGSS